MGKRYFPGISAKQISVTRNDHDDTPLEKRKKLTELDPPLTKDTVLCFALKDSQRPKEAVETTGNEKVGGKSEVKSGNTEARGDVGATKLVATIGICHVDDDDDDARDMEISEDLTVG